MHGWPLLSLVTFLPLVGAGFILMIRGEPDVIARNARYVALWTSLITFVLSLFVWFGFDRGTAAFQFVEEAPWIPQFGITYHMKRRALLRLRPAGSVAYVVSQR